MFVPIWIPVFADEELRGLPDEMIVRLHKGYRLAERMAETMRLKMQYVDASVAPEWKNQAERLAAEIRRRGKERP